MTKSSKQEKMVFGKVPPVEEYRTIKRKVEGVHIDPEVIQVKQKKCTSYCKEWQDETNFHWRTPEHKARSSRCRFCAAKAQKALRDRKKGLTPRSSKTRLGVGTPTVEPGFVRSSKQAAAEQRTKLLGKLQSRKEGQTSAA